MQNEEIMDKNDRITIEAIKIVLGGIEATGELSAKEVLSKAKEVSFAWYMNTCEEELLLRCKILLQCFGEMGFFYEDKFDTIIKKIGWREQDLLKERGRKVKVTKGQIRRLIRRWNPVKQSMPIGKIIEDIIRKINSWELGVFSYTTEWNGKENIYQLIIKDEALFYDKTRNIYYEFEIDK